MKHLSSLAVAGLALFTVACTTAPQPDGGGDRRALSNTELRQLLVGKTVDFAGEARATYFADGRYEFRNGRVDRGTYAISNSQVCVRFTTGRSRCDRYERSGSSYVLINGRGARFPVSVN